MREQSPFPLEGGGAGDGGVTTHPPKGRPAEGSVKRALWAALRQLKVNFRRQVPIGRYIVDFVHHPSKLLIEVDGYYHTVEGATERDAARTAWLVSEGFRIIRFSEKAVRVDRDRVVRQILAETLSPPSPALPPSMEKGE